MVIVCVLAALRPARSHLHFRVKKGFFSRAELEFYQQLCHALRHQQVMVLCKVGLRDIFDFSFDSEHLRALGAKHVDFLVVNQSGQLLYAIELDGKSHQSHRQQAWDQQKNQIFLSARLPLLRFSNHEGVSAAQLQARLAVAQKKLKGQG
ncbi:DUF2726 domain-containing protein [Deinococcus roseus]|uniref:DUF2726 domain-containing protein n=1 Tax=Deinococcus roseus TaxID=392414 RepID=A0ABQ2D3W6_9DEIO|nr:hypothetical protein GCM10008938_33280 [Deinococcus roseus]